MTFNVGKKSQGFLEPRNLTVNYSCGVLKLWEPLFAFSAAQWDKTTKKAHLKQLQMFHILTYMA